MKKTTTPVDIDKYKKKFKFLFEYQIKDGVQQEDDDSIHSLLSEEGEEEEEVVTATPEEGPEGASIETDEVEVEQPIANGPGDEYENTSEIEKELAQKDDITRIKDIQDMQTTTINDMELYVQQLAAEMEQIQMKTIDIDNMKTNIEILRKAVKKITPPTPEESLQNLTALSGGITLKDHWKSYVDENDPLYVVDDEIPTNAPELKKYVMPIKDIKNYGDSYVKDSFNDY